jgi:hypothetical protein
MMTEIVSPTPYADVNTLLLDFMARIQEILGSQFLGFYLYGSLAQGDFDPYTSDIDFIIVIHDEISDALFNALHEMHTHFDRSCSPWVGKIEAAYIPLEALKQAAPTSNRYPQVEKGTELLRIPLEIGWAFQRYILREYGVAVAGPSPRTFADPVERMDMQRAAFAIIGGWQEQSRCDPSWIEWARQRGSQAFIILTLCRILYSLETGSVASKPAAARWAQKNLGRRWNLLIERSLAVQYDKQEIPDIDLDETLAFLSYAAEQSLRGR